jgi:hypothetical protein
MLREAPTAPSKQRHTAKRIFERLVDEHDERVSYSTVSKYVHRRRPEIIAAQARAEAARVAGSCRRPRSRAARLSRTSRTCSLSWPAGPLLPVRVPAVVPK